MYLPKESIIKLQPIRIGAGAPYPKVRLSEHNRGEVQVTPERIEKSSRMADATLRRWFIADKRTWSVSWTGLPGTSTHTVDHFYGAQDLETFYYANIDPVNLELFYGPNAASGTGTPIETAVVFMKDFSSSISKRGTYDFWDVSISFEEV